MEIAFSGVVFGQSEPRERQPIRMLLNLAGKLVEVASFRPKRKQSQLFCFSQRVQIRIILQETTQLSIEERARNAVES